MFEKVQYQVINGVATTFLEHEGLKLKVTEHKPDARFEREECEDYVIVRFSDVALKIELLEEYKDTVETNKCFDVELSLGSINIDIYAGETRYSNGFVYGLRLGARNSIHYKDVLIEVNVAN